MLNDIQYSTVYLYLLPKFQEVYQATHHSNLLLEKQGVLFWEIKH